MSKWVLIDTSYLAHKAFYTMGGLSNSDDIPTGVIFGVLEQVRNICNYHKIRSNKVAFLFDSKHSYRKEAYPLYKDNRIKSGGEIDHEKVKAVIKMKKQLTLLRRKILPSIGFPCFIQPGLESDDLMAMLIQRRLFTDSMVMVTSDQDLYQMINVYSDWYDPTKNKYLTALDFFTEYGIAPELWWKVKCMAGCSSDNVKGIKGVGEKFAVKYLMNQIKEGSKIWKAIHCNNNKKIVKRNESLVRLPHKKTKSIFLISEPQYNKKAFQKWCKKLDMDSYLEGERKEQWEAFFAGKFPKNDSNKSIPKQQRRKLRKRNKGLLK